MPPRITNEEFVRRARLKHGDKYDYSKCNYLNGREKVIIICPIHGEFKQKGRDHLKGHRCPKCFGTPKSNTEDFIEKAKKVYGNEYDYSKVLYRGNKIKVTIICPKHGEWQVTPNNFLRGSRCPRCFGNDRIATEDFIEKASKIHHNKYDYSKVNYTGGRNKVLIICPEHGEFEQIASIHLKGCGCVKCNMKFKNQNYNFTHNITTELFIARSKENHLIKYDYSKVKYTKGPEKVCIICPEHGEFYQGAGYHMHGGNCPKCVGGVRITGDEFISKATVVHNGKYDYSKVKYKNTASKVCIICPEHGEFFQRPNSHLFGAGCPTCPESNLEGEVRQFLIRNKINFEQEKSFSWLRRKKKLYLDFYLPDYKIAIECQGKQHFSPVDMFGGQEFYDLTNERDSLKQQLCADHCIKILYFSNAKIEYPYPVIETYEDLLNAIFSIKKTNY